MKRSILGCVLSAALMTAPGISTLVAAQNGPKQETKDAGEAAKDAGKATGRAAKHAGKATVKGTKKVGSAVKKGVTGKAHATCVDGVRTEGDTEAAAANACSTHGGVAKS